MAGSMQMNSKKQADGAKAIKTNPLMPPPPSNANNNLERNILYHDVMLNENS